LATLSYFYIGVVAQRSSNDLPALVNWVKTKRSYIFFNTESGCSSTWIVGAIAALLAVCFIVCMIVQIVFELTHG
ncbi:hypothetical protein PMAYCL1PPCAC_32842, partial [Pristionchus mayeri]